MATITVEQAKAQVLDLTSRVDNDRRARLITNGQAAEALDHLLVAQRALHTTSDVAWAVEELQAAHEVLGR